MQCLRKRRSLPSFFFFCVRVSRIPFEASMKTQRYLQQDLRFFVPFVDALTAAIFCDGIEGILFILEERGSLPFMLFTKTFHSCRRQPRMTKYDRGQKYPNIIRERPQGAAMACLFKILIPWVKLRRRRSTDLLYEITSCKGNLVWRGCCLSVSPVISEQVLSSLPKREDMYRVQGLEVLEK